MQLWYLLLDGNNILKKYPDQMAAAPKDRANLLKVYDWPVDGNGNNIPKSQCKITKNKKTIKDKENRDIEVDGDVSKKNGS
jgi:hypothetical protein